MATAGAIQRGFTLLETLITLVLIAVLLAVAVPSLIPSPGVELRAAARIVATALRQARLEAQQKHTPVALQVDVEARTLRLEGKSKTRQLPETIALEITAAEQEMETDDIGGIRFFPDGSSTGGRVTLGLEGLSTRVDVEWLTGRVRVTEDDDS